ncbi:BTAD domain-containing putative transcriptional regulator, partial [Actinomadura adrarensis]
MHEPTMAAGPLPAATGSRGEQGHNRRVRIGILGPLEVRDPSGNVVEVRGTRLRALLVRLALDAGRVVPSSRLLDEWWDGDPPVGGGNALQALVSRLRVALGSPEFVEYGDVGYRLAVDAGAVDALAFERAVAAARAVGDVAVRAEELRRALGMWCGPALDGFEGLAFSAHAVRLEELRVAALEDCVEAELAAGTDPASLVVELETLAGAHPLRERLRAVFMRALYAAGRQADALRVFEETRAALAERLGVDPSPELAAVHLSILRQDAAEPRRRAFSNLPAQFTSFVGRAEEFARLDKLLRESRLVTLTGPGGAGKTRLVLEGAGRMVDGLPDGVWFVPLAPLDASVDAEA